jgi:hypothetical protein
MIYNAKYIFFKNKLIRYFIISNLLIILWLYNLQIIANSNQKNFRYVANEAYGFGERLEYKVGYKFITAGTGYFHIMPEPVMVNNRQCYDVRFQVKSLESLDWLYRVRDQYRSVIDVGGIFPWEFEQRIREGNYKRDFTAKFDQFNNLAIVGNKSYEVPEYVHDIVSAFYYVRTLDLKSFKKDSVFYLKNFFDDTTYNLGVRIKGRETIEVDAGKFRCIVIEPMVVEGGLFKSEGNIFVWLSDDERKIPVKVATRIPIGFVEAKLTRFSGLRGPLSAKIN